MEEFQKNVTPEDSRSTSKEVITHSKKGRDNLFEQVSLLQYPVSVQLEFFISKCLIISVIQKKL